MNFLRPPSGLQTSRLQCDDSTDRAGATEHTVIGALSTSTPLARLLLGLPTYVLLGFIRVYQHTLAPILPVITLGRCGCRFSPTCSHYAADAIRFHGALAGTFLAAIRLLKCTPLHPGGFDPVPAPRRKPRCDRIVA
jgi:putative membrane protein insertion efficiency factor